MFVATIVANGKFDIFDTPTLCKVFHFLLNFFYYTV